MKLLFQVGGGSNARLGGRELRLLCGSNWYTYTLLQNRDNSGLLGTPVYCSLKLGTATPLPPPPPPRPPCGAPSGYSDIANIQKGIRDKLSGISHFLCPDLLLPSLWTGGCRGVGRSRKEKWGGGQHFGLVVPYTSCGVWGHAPQKILCSGTAFSTI